MFKKALVSILVLFGACSLYAQEKEIIPWRQNITMLVVPREPMAIQLAQDISRRYPTLLVCYQTTPAQTVLHAWNGEEWLGISDVDYTNGTFFTHRPRRAVIVEKENNSAPELLIPDGTWCNEISRISSTDTRVMIHLLGRHFDFPYRYWMQFAKRYNYELEEINPALINVPWIHYRGDEIIAAFKARDDERDMDKWSTLNITSPEPIEPVLMEEDPGDLPPAEIPAEKTENELGGMSDKDVINELVEMPTNETIEVETQPKHVEITVETAAPEAPSIERKEVEKELSLPEPVEKTAPELMKEIQETVEEDGVNLFSTNDVPAAEVILPQ